MSVEGAQEFSVQVAASPSKCFRTIIDFERYPEWSSAVRSTSILEVDDIGIGRLVEFRIDLRFKTIRYVLEYAYRKPTELTWRSVDGDVESIEGVYRFRKLDPSSTEVTCRQTVRTGFWIPGPLRNLVERTALRESVLEFKTEVERRAAAQAKRSGGAKRRG